MLGTECAPGGGGGVYNVNNGDLMSDEAYETVDAQFQIFVSDKAFRKKISQELSLSAGNISTSMLPMFTIITIVSDEDIQHLA